MTRHSNPKDAGRRARASAKRMRRIERQQRRAASYRQGRRTFDQRVASADDIKALADASNAEDRAFAMRNETTAGGKAADERAERIAREMTGIVGLFGE